MGGSSPSLEANATRASRADLKAFLNSRVGYLVDPDRILRHTLPHALQYAAAPAGETNVTTWFRCVVMRAIVDCVRQLEPAGVRERAWRAAAASSPAEDSAALRRWFVRQLDSLEPAQASLLQLVELDGTSLPIAAAVLNLTPQRAGEALDAARRQFRAQLEAFCHASATSACLD